LLRPGPVSDGASERGLLALPQSVGVFGWERLKRGRGQAGRAADGADEVDRAAPAYVARERVDLVVSEVSI
jgi:hypothetical protein